MNTRINDEEDDEIGGEDKEYPTHEGTQELELIKLQGYMLTWAAEFLGATAKEGDSLACNEEVEVDLARADVAKMVSFLATDIRERMQGYGPGEENPCRVA